MPPDPDRCRWCRSVVFLSFVTGMTVAWATGATAKNPQELSGASSDPMVPAVLKARTDPTLRYPVMSESGWSVGSFSYGWFDISRNSVRYSVVEPSNKTKDGFDIPRGEIGEVSVNWRGWNFLNFRPLKEERGSARKFYLFAYVPQDHWGKAHTAGGLAKFCLAWVPGTEAMASGMLNFADTVDAFVDVPVRNGDLARVEVLLKDNPDLALYKDSLGMTPLHWAAAGGHRDMVELLLAHGANVNARDNAGETPLQAANYGHRDVAEFLRQHGGPDVTPPGTALPDVAEAGVAVKVPALLKDHPALAASGVDFAIDPRTGYSKYTAAQLIYHVLQRTHERSDAGVGVHDRQIYRVFDIVSVDEGGYEYTFTPRIYEDRRYFNFGNPEHFVIRYSEVATIKKNTFGGSIQLYRADGSLIDTLGTGSFLEKSLKALSTLCPNATLK